MILQKMIKKKNSSKKKIIDCKSIDELIEETKDIDNDNKNKKDQ